MIGFTPEASAKISNACDFAMPHEACGFLLGYADGADSCVIDLALPASAAGSFDAFELSDREVSRVAAHAADRALDIVAIFHSHPSGHAWLSDVDLASIRFSEWPWVLATRSRAGGLNLQAFAAGTAEPIDVRWSSI